MAPAGVAHRPGPGCFGFLTVDEAAEQYGVDLERIANAVDAEGLGPVMLEFQEGGALTPVPTSDSVVSAWFAAARWP